MTGWVINQVADTITFDSPPPAGVSNIVVRETASSAVNATDVWAFGAWNPGFGYPAEGEFYSDRLFTARTYRQPQTLWASKAGQYIDHGKSVPLIDDDALSLTINARQVNAIQELVPLTDLQVLTTSCEWKLEANEAVVAPGKVGFKPQTFWGASSLPALVVGESALFVTRSGDAIRDIAFAFTDDKYKGNELSIFAAHLFRGRRIVDWAFQQHPYSCAWIVLDDGTLACLTYVREQEVVGWSLHTTDGLFKRCCVVPENGSDALYVTVLRVCDGVEHLHTEKLAKRDLVPDQRMAFFVDSGLTYDGRAQPGTMKIDFVPGDFGAPSVWSATASVPVFTLGGTDVGDVIRVRSPVVSDVNGDQVTSYVEYRVQIVAVNSTTSAEVLPLSQPADLAVWESWRVPSEQVTYTDWEFLRDTISGLDHLEGRSVSVLADAQVLGPYVVAGGAITLGSPSAVVHVGLPYTALIESLDLNVQGAETIRDDPKLITAVTLVVDKTRGVRSGPDTARLDEFKVREFEGYEDPLSLVSGILRVNVSNNWDRNGRFLVVQTDPLPVTVLSLVPKVAVGKSG